MSKWLPPLVASGLGLAIGAVVGVSYLVAQPPSPGPGGAREGQQQTPPPPDVRAAEALHESYDGLNLVSIWLSSRQAKLPGDVSGLVDSAKDFYRQAHQAYQSRAYARSEALALAANDAARGLLGVMHADTPPAAGLPPPPEPAPEGPPPGNPQEVRGAPGQGGGPGAPRGPADAARQAFRAAYQRIVDASKQGPGKGPSQTFLDASRKVYEEGRQAYQKRDYSKAIDLAVAAEAWTHVGEHLLRAEGRAGSSEGLQAEPRQLEGGTPPPPRPSEKAPPPRPADRG